MHYPAQLLVDAPSKLRLRSASFSSVGVIGSFGRWKLSSRKLILKGFPPEGYKPESLFVLRLQGSYNSQRISRGERASRSLSESSSASRITW